MRRRTASGLADAHTHTRQQKLCKILCIAAYRGHETPQKYRPGDYVAPVRAVCVACDRYTRGDVEYGEGETRQKTQLAIC